MADEQQPEPKPQPAIPPPRPPRGPRIAASLGDDEDGDDSDEKKPKPNQPAAPRKETVRINLVPKPTDPPSIKLPTLPPGGPTATGKVPVPAAGQSGGLGGSFGKPEDLQF